MWRQCIRLIEPVSADYARYLAGIFVRQLLLVAGGFSLVWLLRVAAPGSTSSIWLLIAGMIAFDSSVVLLDGRLGMFFVRRVSFPLFRHLRLTSLRKVLEMPMQWHHRHNAVELVSKLNNGAGKIVQTTDTAGRELLPALIRTILNLIPLVWFSIATAPIVIFGLVTYLWITTRENLLRRRFRTLRHDQYANDSGMFTECVHNVNALVQFGQTGRVLGRYEDLQGDIIEHGTAEMEIAHRYAEFRNLLIVITRRVSQGFWLWQYQRGRLDAPMVMYLNVLTDELIGSFGTYAGVMERVYEGVEPARTVVGLLSDPTETRVIGTGVTHDVPAEIGLELRNIHFSYEIGSEVLRGLNLTIKPGSILGIVGVSGIGKTTLQHLLSRMLDTDRGEVIVGGKDVRRWPVRQLRSMFSTVSQNGAVLFSHQSVAEAIRFARPEATLQEVVDAARCACIHNEILRMPEGYDTILGPGGVHLSKGQQQRVGLTQALLGLKDRKILILDEFTSALDSRTEQQIIDNLKPRLKGKTVIIIAHRLATLHKLADRVVVLEGGKVVEEGSHTELVAQDSRYAELVRLQSIA